MKIRAASANFTLSSVCNPRNLSLRTGKVEGRPVYLPFYVSSFLLDDKEEFFVASNAVTRRLEKEEAGIKIFVSGSQRDEKSIEERFVLSPSRDEFDIQRQVTRKVTGKTVRHLQTDLVYFPGLFIRDRRRSFPWLGNKGLFVNLSSGTAHSVPGCHASSPILETEQTLRFAFEDEAKSKCMKLPGRSLPCLASERFVLWLIDNKKERLRKELTIAKIFCSYKPFYVFKYYARRPRAVKCYECCSVSAVTGRWSSFAHKILEYDRLRSFGVVQEGGRSSTLIEEVAIGREEARSVAVRNVRRLPGVIQVRVAGSEVIYLPVWTVHLEDSEFVHKIEICGVTGYVVAEQSVPKEQRE
jgi:hypothetical protein